MGLGAALRLKLRSYASSRVANRKPNCELQGDDQAPSSNIQAPEKLKLQASIRIRSQIIRPIGYLPGGKNNLGFASPHLARRNWDPTFKQPKPYLQLRRKLMEDASLKYFVGQLTSPIVNPCHKICAIIWLSKTKSSEFKARFGSSFFSNPREKARYPV